MRRFGVDANRTPTLDLEDRTGHVARLVPRGLRIIGSNGRVDMAESFEAPDWQAAPAERRCSREAVSEDWLKRVLQWAISTPLPPCFGRSTTPWKTCASGTRPPTKADERDRSSDERKRTPELYQVRNQIAHGDLRHAGINLPTVIEDFNRIQSSLARK